MPISTINIEWLNANSQRKYPLADHAQPADVTGTFVLPDDFIVGLDLPVHAGIDVSSNRFFVQNVGIYANGFSVAIGYQPNSGDSSVVAVAMISRDQFTVNSVWNMAGINDFADTSGKITIGRLENIDAQPGGFFTFDYAATPIESDCIRPMIRGVSSIRVTNGAETSEPLYGDIELVAQNNFQLTPIIVSGQDPQIRFSAVAGEGLNEVCVCVGDDATSPPIRRINGIPPTPAGDFTLLGNDCLQIIGIENGVRLDDTCSSPCCGCTELEKITNDLTLLFGYQQTMSTYLSRLETQLTSLNQVVLGSKISDSGCVSCQ